jgi:YhcH/YjgK/YiaL family protein
MIVGELKSWRSLTNVKGLEPAFEFLEQASSRELPAGKHPIDGDRFFAIVVRADSRSPETAEFEAHRKYIDIQYLVSGRELIGVAPTEKLQVLSPYDETKEAALYSIPAEYAKLEMEPDRFAIFFPNDAHMPNCHLGATQTASRIKASLDCCKGANDVTEYSDDALRLSISMDMVPARFRAGARPSEPQAS